MNSESRYLWKNTATSATEFGVPMACFDTGRFVSVHIERLSAISAVPRPLSFFSARPDSGTSRTSMRISFNLSCDREMPSEIPGEHSLSGPFGFRNDFPHDIAGDPVVQSISSHISGLLTDIHACLRGGSASSRY